MKWFKETLDQVTGGQVHAGALLSPPDGVTVLDPLSRCEPAEWKLRSLEVRVLPSWFPCRLFLGPGFRLGARWNRLGEAVKTRKKRGKTGKKWARYGLRRSVNQGS